MTGSRTDGNRKITTRIHKIGPSKKFRYKEKIKSTKHSERNSNLQGE